MAAAFLVLLLAVVVPAAIFTGLLMSGEIVAAFVVLVIFLVLAGIGALS